MDSVESQTYTNAVYWHRVADGVIHLKVRTYDQNGNEPWVESTDYGNDFQPGRDAGDYAASSMMSYPLRETVFPYFTSNTLPNAVDVEIGILEPDGAGAGGADDCRVADRFE